jgi:hypothetical protein
VLEKPWLLGKWSLVPLFATRMLERPQHASYLNWKSQNEFLELLSESVNKEIKSEVESAQFFAVMADTTPDTSHLDQLSLVLRYVTPQCVVRE